MQSINNYLVKVSGNHYWKNSIIKSILVTGMGDIVFYNSVSDSEVFFIFSPAWHTSSMIIIV